MGIDIPHLSTHMEMSEGKLFNLWWPQREDTRAKTRKALVIPESLRVEILKANHDDLLSGHLGFDRTYQKMKEKYWWPSMRKEIASW